jgi:hypothetical protein
MGRLTELAFIALLVWLFFPSLTRLLRAAVGLPRPTRPAGGPARASTSGASPGPAAGAEILVRCVRCGVYFPRSRSRSGDALPGDLFCSDDCRRQGAAPSS